MGLVLWCLGCLTEEHYVSERVVGVEGYKGGVVEWGVGLASGLCWGWFGREFC